MSRHFVAVLFFLVLVKIPVGAEAYWTCSEEETLQEAFSSVEVWLSGNSPWMDDSHGMSVHPFLTLLSIKRYEQETGEKLDLDLKVQIVQGAIEEAYSVVGMQNASNYPPVTLDSDLGDPAVAAVAQKRRENHFLGIDVLTGKENPLKDVSLPDWGISNPKDAITWALEDNRNTCNLKSAVEMLDEDDPQKRLMAYRCLGHALHVLQKMSVPANVRNDMYLDSLDALGYHTGRKTLSSLWQSYKTTGQHAMPDFSMQVADAATYFRELAQATAENYFSDDTKFVYEHAGVHPPLIDVYEDGDYFRSVETGSRIAFKGNLYHAVRYNSMQETGDSDLAVEMAGPFTKIDEEVAVDTFEDTGFASVAFGAALIESFVSWEDDLMGQEPFSDPNDNDTTDVDLVITQVDASQAPDEVTVYASVVTQHGDPLENLTPGNFQVFETVGGSESEVKVDSVTTSESSGATVSVCLVIDSSGSMGEGPGSDLEAAKEAAKLFVDKMKFSDRAAIVDFSSDVTLLQDFTSDHGLLHQAIDNVQPGGGTRLWDAVVYGVDLTSSQAGQKAVIALSDGDDTESSSSLSEAIMAGQNASLPVFTVGLGVDAQTEQQLISLSDSTNAGKNGSGYFAAPDASALQNLYDIISNTLKKTYIISWASSGSHGDIVEVDISVTYTCANGTFTDNLESDYVVP